MSNLTWVMVEDYDDRPVFGPPCPGPAIHRWELTVDEGNVYITSGCPDCDVWLEPESISAYLVGSLTFEHEHKDAPCPNAIRFLPCDCNWWWRFHADREVKS